MHPGHRMILDHPDATVSQSEANLLWPLQMDRKTGATQYNQGLV
jgi:hypothetical protein